MNPTPRIFLLVVAFAAFPAAGQTNPHDTPADRVAGGRIFRTHCAPCHGTKATGGTGPDLTTGVFIHGSTDEDLYRNISEGIPGTAMPDQFFNGTQIWQVVAFVRSLGQQAPAPPVPGSPAHGRELVVQKGCTGCHLIRGEGGVRGPDLSVIGSQRSYQHLRDALLNPDASVAQQYWSGRITGQDNTHYTGFILNQDTYSVQLLDFNRGLVTVPRTAIREFVIDRKSLMPSYQGKLKDAELDDVLSYLVSLKRAKGAAE